jgi:arginine decarboxylase
MNRAPLYEQLRKHRAAGHRSFHVPGHKSGQGVAGEAAQDFRAMLSIDMTEIPGLDDLHHPEEAIAEAQELAARYFGAEHTFFLVNGSTGGNLAMVLATCQEGDLLLVQRNVHKSVIHALMLAKAKAVFLHSATDANSGLTIGLQAEQVLDALGKYPEAKGLLVTNPSYYGLGVDLKSIAELLHQRDKVLLVDEAHGAHYGLHSSLPPSALASGADVVVQSTHKMLTSMTMGAMLHLQGPRVRRAGIARYLGMLQSSSPSYPILASLDVCRMQLQNDGERMFELAFKHLAAIRQALEATKRIKLWETPQEQENVTKDPFKLALYDRYGEWNGFELKAMLEQQGCYPELADPKYVLLLCSIATSVEDTKALIEAIHTIEAGSELRNEYAPVPVMLMEAQQLPISEPISFDREEYVLMERIEVEVQQCAGWKAAEMIVPYPPGIPILYPGEWITSAVQAYLLKMIVMKSRFHGHDVTSTGTVPVWYSKE